MPNQEMNQNQSDYQRDRNNVNRWLPLLLPVFFFLGYIGRNAMDNTGNQSNTTCTPGNTPTSLNK